MCQYLSFVRIPMTCLMKCMNFFCLLNWSVIVWLVQDYRFAIFFCISFLPIEFNEENSWLREKIPSFNEHWPL